MQNSTTVLLVPAGIDTAWFCDLIARRARWWTFRGRIKFDTPPGVHNPGHSSVVNILAEIGPETEPGFAGVRDNVTGRQIG